MNQDIPTPRTDAAWQRSKTEIGNWRDIAFDMRYFSQDLERENAAYRKTLEHIAELDGDKDAQKFRMTRFQAAQMARVTLRLYPGQTNPATGNVAPAQGQPEGRG